ncbi:MAG: hypothetical protein LC623_02890 [Halobacteriales archaeon]|nr:hypothetical protein [Halobacteriales archaeon]
MAVKKTPEAPAPAEPVGRSFQAESESPVNPALVARIKEAAKFAQQVEETKPGQATAQEAPTTRKRPWPRAPSAVVAIVLAVAVGAGGTVGLTALLDHKPPPTGLNQGPVGVSPDDIVQGVQHFSGTLAAATSQVSVPCEDVGVCEAHPFAVQGDRNVSFTANLKARLPGVPGNGAAAPTFQVVIRTSGNHATIVSTQKTGTVATVNATLSNGTYEVFIQLLDGGPVDYTLDGILDPAHIIHTVVCAPTPRRTRRPA